MYQVAKDDASYFKEDAAKNYLLYTQGKEAAPDSEPAASPHFQQPSISLDPDNSTRNDPSEKTSTVTQADVSFDWPDDASEKIPTAKKSSPSKCTFWQSVIKHLLFWIQPCFLAFAFWSYLSSEDKFSGVSLASLFMAFVFPFFLSMVLGGAFIMHGDSQFKGEIKGRLLSAAIIFPVAFVMLFNASSSAAATAVVVDNRTVFWQSDIEIYHAKKDCSALDASLTIHSSTLPASLSSGLTTPCDLCVSDELAEYAETLSAQLNKTVYWKEDTGNGANNYYHYDKYCSAFSGSGTLCSGTLREASMNNRRYPCSICTAVGYDFSISTPPPTTSTKRIYTAEDFSNAMLTYRYAVNKH
jgi:hypothetical protein